MEVQLLYLFFSGQFYLGHNGQLFLFQDPREIKNLLVIQLLALRSVSQLNEYWSCWNLVMDLFPNCHSVWCQSWRASHLTTDYVLDKKEG